jgi:hypothetical protein
MSAKSMGEKRFTSWKEIAEYLNCSVRTCTRWEQKYSLPIHRIDEESKTSVYAYKNELDEWLQKRKKKDKSFNIRDKRVKRLYSFLPLIIPVLFLIYFFLIKEVPILQPADFKIVNSTLVILDERGKELWEYDTGVENLADDPSYQKRFQYKRDPEVEADGKSTLLPWIINKDLNNDQKLECLFCINTQDEYKGGKLICFNQEGKVNWEFFGGREIKFGSETFADFGIKGFDVYDLEGDGFLETILISRAVHRFPTQICVLDHKGQSLGEYWNSGHLADFCFADLNGDGRDELVIVGLNNEYKKGSLIALDPLNLMGCSPQQQYGYSCQTLGVGSELYYVLFPRTEVDYLMHDVEAIRYIKILENNLFSIQMGFSGIIFILDFKLKLQNIVLSHGFKNLHSNYLREGKISSEINEDYERNLANALLYWNGQNWVSTPTMTSYWKNKDLNQ